jgi:predicted HAD superfamily phosphohydrolase
MNVHTGFVATPRAGRSSFLRTWSIWHRNQDVRLMSVDELRLAPLAGLGLRLGDPLWTFYVESVDYEVYLPARRVAADMANKEPTLV